MKVLILGKSGQLASCFSDYFIKEKVSYKCLGKEDIDIFSDDWQTEVLAEDFDYLINCMAYTKVDLAESEQKSADRLNTYLPKELALICNKKNACLMHYSTDYVFHQKSSEAEIFESADFDPINFYGASKAKGEVFVSEISRNYFIFRTSWVVSEYGHNFVKTMIRLAKEKDSLQVVDDQWGRPTYAADLAKYSFLIASAKDSEKGIYHICNADKTTWCEFAREIIAKGSEMGLCKSIDVNGLSTEDYPTPAARPKHNVLSLKKSEEALGFSLPSWKEALPKILQKLNSSYDA